MAVDRGDEFVADDVVVDEPEAKVDENVVEEPEVKVEEPEVKVEEPARDEKGKFIPKGRFDEAVGKERAARETAERKLAELQAFTQELEADDYAAARGHGLALASALRKLSTETRDLYRAQRLAGL